jgi:hypothetical protein
MRIHRSRPRERFTIIPDGTLRDIGLSYAARGLLGELLSRPDDWHTTLAEIIDRAARERGGRKPGTGASDSRRVLTAAWRELETAGYLRRVRIRGPDGRITTEVHVHDRPHDAS